MDEPILNFDYPTKTPNLKEYLKDIYGMFEEQYRNHPKGSTISHNAKLSMSLMENVFGEVLINKEK